MRCFGKAQGQSRGSNHLKANNDIEEVTQGIRKEDQLPLRCCSGAKRNASTPQPVSDETAPAVEVCSAAEAKEKGICPPKGQGGAHADPSGTRRIKGSLAHHSQREGATQGYQVPASRSGLRVPTTALAGIPLLWTGRPGGAS